MNNDNKFQQLKRNFDKEVNRCFELAESLEDLLNSKIKMQEADHLNRDHLADVQKANMLLSLVVLLLDKKSTG